MKTIDELNTSKVPIVVFDQSLNKLDDKVLFPEKVKKAKDTINKIGLPESPKPKSG